MNKLFYPHPASAYRACAATVTIFRYDLCSTGISFLVLEGESVFSVY